MSWRSLWCSSSACSISSAVAEPQLNVKNQKTMRQQQQELASTTSAPAQPFAMAVGSKKKKGKKKYVGLIVFVFYAKILLHVHISHQLGSVQTKCEAVTKSSHLKVAVQSTRLQFRDTGI